MLFMGFSGWIKSNVLGINGSLILNFLTAAPWWILFRKSTTVSREILVS